MQGTADGVGIWPSRRLMSLEGGTQSCVHLDHRQLFPHVQ